jgi:uncharacterized protein
MIHDHETISIIRTRRKIFVILFTIIAIASVAIGIKKIYFTKVDVSLTLKNAVIHSPAGNIQLQLEIADTPQKQEEGLMFRRVLAKNSGMLFKFDQDTQNPFWMKNTLIPLDILFVDKDFKVADSLTMEPCAADPCQLYFSSAPYRYAIELTKGFVEDHKISRGDTIELPAS